MILDCFEIQRILLTKEYSKPKFKNSMGINKEILKKIERPVACAVFL